MEAAQISCPDMSVFLVLGGGTNGNERMCMEMSFPLRNQHVAPKVHPNPLTYSAETFLYITGADV